MSRGAPANRRLRLQALALALIMLAPWGLYFAAQAGNGAALWTWLAALTVGMLLALSIR